MNGEEAGAEGRAFAHISTGANAGTTYELPYLGKFSWENSVASPFVSNKTVVAGMDDATPGQVYFYIGTKTNTGTEIEKAGLSGGKLFGVKVTGLTVEGTGVPAPNTVFTLADLGQVQNTTGAALETASDAAGVTEFLRPEDGAWDPKNPADFYFVTTNSFTAPSRLWRLRFSNPSSPESGGTITAVLDGTEGPKMMDNMVIDNYGHIMIQEDPGNQAHLAKIWQYTIATDAVKLIATHDAERFVTGGVNFLTQDEEASGIIDMEAILGVGNFIYVDQAHYAQPGSLVEGGQLLSLFNPDTKNSFLGAGPQSSHAPYLLPVAPGVKTNALLTVGDSVGTYKMAGLGDGLGAYDNGNGTFTLLMNHEMVSTVGATHAHGQKGAFVSKWTINKSNLIVTSGSDLIKNVNIWNGTGYTLYNAANPGASSAFNRFCAGDLPAPSAFYNPKTMLGTEERIYMNGEEAGAEGRAFGHIATGVNAGTTYELPYLGKFSWENAVASPFTSNKTVVAGMDDATPGQVYFYIGTKTNTGTVIEKAGLSGGKLYGVKVSGLTLEVSASVPTAGTAFTLADLGQVQNSTGAALETASDAAGVTEFLRPEDGAWDPNNPKDFYFVTTNSFTAPSRLWRLRFTDPSNPETGGTITAVLDGTEGPKMMDNMVIDNFGHILIQEDPGNQSYLARIWQYDIATDAVKAIATHDAEKFVTGAPNFLTQDEESSGIIDMQEILGVGNFIYVDQAHYAIPGALVEGGQLLTMFNPDTKASVPNVSVTGNNVSIANNDASPSFADNTDFGNVMKNTSKVLPLVIKNEGPGALTIKSIRFEGYDAAEFALVTPPAFPISIAINGTQTINVQFTPNSIDGKVTSIIIETNDVETPEYNFVLQGIGIHNVGVKPVISESSRVKLYPNPTSGNTTLSINLENEENLEIMVIDVLGKEVTPAISKISASGETSLTLNTSGLSTGLYFVKITTSNTIYVTRLLKN
ncbi:MAG: alkaline phosphatase PhoX [Bacteroidia bacterium]